MKLGPQSTQFKNSVPHSRVGSQEPLIFFPFVPYCSISFVSFNLKFVIVVQQALKRKSLFLSIFASFACAVVRNNTFQWRTETMRLSREVWVKAVQKMLQTVKKRCSKLLRKLRKKILKLLQNLNVLFIFTTRSC